MEPMEFKMSKRVVVINPNSTRSVTDAISASVDIYRSDAAQIDCLTLDAGPPAVSGYFARASVAAPLKELIEHETEADAFVIACFGDPSVMAMREVTKVPVLGMAESSFYVGMSVADMFGIISTTEAATQRHYRQIRELGIQSRFAGDTWIGTTILELRNDEEATFARLMDAATRLRKAGAGAFITGCAGMAIFRERLEAELGQPVIEPAQAGVALALGIAAMSSRH